MHYKWTSCAAAALLIAGLGTGINSSDARTSRHLDRDAEEEVDTRIPGTPVMAVVGLREQRISIYSAKGKIMEAPVSSGQTGYETPAGIYSIVQKEEEHHSNLYDDASMPFMERITWTGMALHAGVLPGYPASHGCVRLQHGFAERLYEVTKLGMRVVVVREDIAPVEVPQPFLFSSSRARTAMARDGISPAVNAGYSASAGNDLLSRLRTELATRSAAAENAARRVRDTRLAASRKASEAASAAKTLRTAEAAAAKADADLKAAEQAASAAGSAQADAAKAKAQTVYTQLDAAKAQAQAKDEAAAQAKAEAKAADAAFAAAMDAAEEAKQNMAPVSVFISRRTQRLYVRKANQPVFEAPVLIRDADKPIGSFVFTALDYGAAGSLRWSVVSMYKDALHIEPFAKGEKQGGSKTKRVEAALADSANAEAALGRLTIPQEALDRMSEAVLPGSSLIISDEGPSGETGKDTDFIVFMSGEPQGGIAVRSHHHNDGWAKRDGGWFFDGESSWRSSRGRSSRGGWGGGGGGWGFPF